MKMDERARLFKHIKPSYMICNWDTKEILVFMAVFLWAILVRPHVAIIVFVLYIVFETLKVYKDFIKHKVPNSFKHFLFWVGLMKFSNYPKSSEEEFIA